MTKNILGLEGFNVIDTAESEDSVTVRVQQKKEFRVCSECGSVRCVSAGKRKRHFRDIEYKGKFCGIEIVSTRYRCQDCGATCYPPIDALMGGFRMTKRFYQQICEECFQMPFTTVAANHGLEETLVRRAFGAYADMLDEDWIITVPRVLGIDECHLANEARAVFVEQDRRNGNRLIQMAKDRKKSTVISVLESMIPNEEHEDWPEIVTMDFTEGYRSAVEDVFGANTKIVIDHFHVQKLITDATSAGYAAIKAEMEEAVRQMDGEKADAFRKKWNRAKISVKLFRTNKEDLTNTQKDRLVTAFSLWPDFATLYACKEEFRRTFNMKKSKKMDAPYDGVKDRKEAEEKYEKWVKRIPKGDAYKEMRKAVRTIKRWRKEVFNFFECERFSNGAVEALNGVIKHLNRMGRGYSYEVIRAKALHRTTVSSKPKYKRVSFQEKEPAFRMGYMTSFGFDSSMKTNSGWKTKTVLDIGCGLDLNKLSKALCEMVPDIEIAAEEFADTI